MNEQDKEMLKKALKVAGIVIVVLVIIALIFGSRTPDVTVFSAPIDSTNYPDDPQIDLEFSCDDAVITSETQTVRAPAFARFRFTNTGTAKQRFGVRPLDGEGAGKSTMAIAPQTKASFSWRIPAVSEDIEVYCSDHPTRTEDLLSTITITAN